MSTLARGFSVGVLAAIVWLGSPGSVRAEIGALDNVPAATLLLPYFEVDLDDPNGAQTRFTVNNVDGQPTVAHVSLWSDLGVPTLNFDLYLGGYDSVEVDLRLLFGFGILPQTGPGQHEAGPFSDLPLQYPNCGGQLPAPDQLPPAFVDHLRAAHTGNVSPLFGQCLGLDAGDNVARGYVTVDVVNECSIAFPGDPGYFVNGGFGIASNENRLFGDFTIIDRAIGEAVTAPLVAIEASATDPITSTPGRHTFYGSLLFGSADDNREPLGTIWNARYLAGGINEADLIVWRDPGGPGSPFACGTLPIPFPLDETNIVAFDEDENGAILASENVYLPFATQRVPVTELTPFNFGFLQLNLDTFTPVGTAFDSPGLLQSYVLIRHRVSGRGSILTPATRLFGPQHQPAGPESCGSSNLCGVVPVVIE